jgi:hypothetical protein
MDLPANFGIINGSKILLVLSSYCDIIYKDLVATITKRNIT